MVVFMGDVTKPDTKEGLGLLGKYLKWSRDELMGEVSGGDGGIASEGPPPPGRESAHEEVAGLRSQNINLHLPFPLSSGRRRRPGSNPTNQSYHL